MREKEERIIQACRMAMSDMEIGEVDIEKSNNGRLLKGIYIKRKGASLSMLIYWEDMEQILGRDYSEKSAVEYIRKMTERYLDVFINTDDIYDWDKAKFYIRKKVVNYERNQEHLGKVVHKRCLDLAEVYYLQVLVAGEGKGFIEITGKLQKYWGISEKELISWANRNMYQEEYSLRSIQEVLAGYTLPSETEVLPMYFISNWARQYGAAIITRPDLLKEVLGELKGSCFLLPSSQHELICLPEAVAGDIGYYQKVVYEVNRQEVKEADFLSDHVYYYNAKAGTIEICRTAQETETK